ncbi:MAG: NAD-binding protein [Candidatus Aminicenantes bacterium]|nr:NAD-binding protein [Candidatus Aminicenantes bacterium]
MNEEQQKVLVFGIGGLGKVLIKTISTDWHVIVVDMDEDRIKQCKKELPEEEYHHGAAGSMVTWKKLNLENLRYMVSTIKDTAVNVEACRIARSKFGLDIPIIILHYGEADEKFYESFHVTLINALEPGIRMILKSLEKSSVKTAYLGLGKGELIEVEIKTRSHLVGRKLKHLRPSQWHISAIYRDNKLIMPEGSSSLKIGDRVVLVGNPGVLENVTTTLLKGIPQFPLQYGSDIVFPLHQDFNANLDEAILWLDKFKAQRIQFIPFKKKLSHRISEKIKTDVERFRTGRAIELFKELFMLSLDMGVLIIPAERGWFKNYRVRHTFRKSQKPFLLSRLTFPYEDIVVLLNGPAPIRSLETGIEISQLLNISYRVLYVTLPKEMRGREEDKELRLCQEIISDFEGIYKKPIDYKVLVGNPVRQVLTYLKPLENHLFIVASDPNASISFFKSNVPYLVARNTRLSTLVIPEAPADD